ncbi:MAG: glycosyltransferase [Rhodobacteraceae bacterium]|nr:glycosyltransferase [Paracoccaceae bacterium]
MSLPAAPVTILLCTHNGARFLGAQLASIAAQSLTDWALWVSDDGSTDGTWDLLEAFRAAHPARQIRLLRGAGQGAAANYLSLLCHPDLTARRIAFCDQDDVWLPQKLARACAALDRAGPGPCAYAAASIVTDAGLNEIGRIPPAPRGGSFANALVQNILHGGTTVLSAEAHALMRRAGPVDVGFHDWWTYLVMTGCGAALHLDPEPALHYRQHGHNQIGYNRAAGAARGRAGLIFSGAYRDWMIRNTHALLHADLPLQPAHRQTARRFLDLQGTFGPVRAAGYRKLALQRQSPTATAAMLVCAGLGYA